MTTRPVTLPYPPSANAYWRMFHNRILVSKEARAYKARAGLLALAAGMRPLEGELEVLVHAYRPRKVGDLDNLLKVLLDSLRGVAWADDSQVRCIHAVRFDDRADPRVELWVRAFQLPGVGT